MINRRNLRCELIAQTNELPTCFEGLEEFAKPFFTGIVFGGKRLRNSDIRIDEVFRHVSNVVPHSLESCELVFF